MGQGQPQEAQGGSPYNDLGGKGWDSEVGANGHTVIRPRQWSDVLTLHGGCEKKRGIVGLGIRSSELEVQSRDVYLVVI